MSSPVHHPKHLDSALMYAPPWARRPREPSPDEAIGDEADQFEDQDNTEMSFVGDRAMVELRRRLSLDPEQVPEPPLATDHRSGAIGMLLRGCAIGSVAAFAAWAITSWPAINAARTLAVQAAIVPPDAPRQVKLIHVRTAMPVPAAVAEPAIPPSPQAVRTDRTVVAAINPEVPPAAVAAAVAPDAVAPLAVAPAADAPAQAPSPAALALDKDELATLIQRGKDYLANGDLSSARLLLRRAADGGSAEGALALGATFDPLVLRRLAAIGAEPDVERARKWYRRAAELGSSAATEHLAALAQAQ